jgi:hypothetical protein
MTYMGEIPTEIFGVDDSGAVMIVRPYGYIGAVSALANVGSIFE